MPFDADSSACYIESVDSTCAQNTQLLYGVQTLSFSVCLTLWVADVAACPYLGRCRFSLSVSQGRLQLLPHVIHRPAVLWLLLRNVGQHRNLQDPKLGTVSCWTGFSLTSDNVTSRVKQWTMLGQPPPVRIRQKQHNRNAHVHVHESTIAKPPASSIFAMCGCMWECLTHSCKQAVQRSQPVVARSPDTACACGPGSQQPMCADSEHTWYPLHQQLPQSWHMTTTLEALMHERTEDMQLFNGQLMCCVVLLWLHCACMPCKQHACYLIDACMWGWHGGSMIGVGVQGKGGEGGRWEG